MQDHSLHIPVSEHAAMAANTVQWSVILGFLLITAGVYFMLQSTLRKYAEVDLLDYGNMRAFMKSRWYPFVFQLPAFIFFVLIAYYLFRGPQDYSQNPGAILTWTFWWAILPFTFILLGRFWCAICPFAWISDFVQKFAGRRRRPPAWIRTYSFWIIDIIFIFITWFDRVYGMTDHPILTGFIFLGILAGVIICGFLYERRVFCRYICFLGNVAGNYSMVAPLEIKPKNPEVCRDCKEKFCCFGRDTQAGCPYFQVVQTKDGNRFCTLCANCVKSCPRDNVALMLRPFGSDFWKKLHVKFEESFFAKILVGVVIIQNIGMLTLWGTISNFVKDVTRIQSDAVAFTITYFAAISVPLVLMFISSYFSAKFSREKIVENFARFGYAFIAVDLAGHLAHNLSHLLSEGKTVIAAVAGLFLGGVEHLTDLAILHAGTVKVLQYLILILGVVGTFSITYSISKRKAESKKELFLTMLPHIVLLTALMLLNFYIFSLPMEHRSH